MKISGNNYDINYNIIKKNLYFASFLVYYILEPMLKFENMNEKNIYKFKKDVKFENKENIVKLLNYDVKRCVKYFYDGLIGPMRYHAINKPNINTDYSYFNNFKNININIHYGNKDKQVSIHSINYIKKQINHCKCFVYNGTHFQFPIVFAIQTILDQQNH